MTISAVTVVTGGTGAVGQAVVGALRARGQKSIAIGRHAITDEDHLAVDLSRTELLGALKGRQVDAVVHLASPIPSSAADRRADLGDTIARIDDNVRLAVAVWDVPVVYASTCGLYASGGSLPLGETSILRGSTPYLAAKLRGEAAFGDVAAILRISSPSGPSNATSVLRRFIDAARTGLPLDVWGSGVREQDFIDARDLADLVLAILDHPTLGHFNAVRGTPTTMLELAVLIADRFPGTAITVGDHPDPLDGQLARFDPHLAAATFAWRATTPLPATIDWIAQSLESCS